MKIISPLELVSTDVEERMDRTKEDRKLGNLKEKVPMSMDGTGPCLPWLLLEVEFLPYPEKRNFLRLVCENE